MDWGRERDGIMTETRTGMDRRWAQEHNVSLTTRAVTRMRSEMRAGWKVRMTWRAWQQSKQVGQERNEWLDVRR